MNKKRPINLDLRTINLPISALTSITHRVTGVMLFFGIPFALYAFDISLKDEVHFIGIQLLMTDQVVIKIITHGFLASLGFHLLAGVRHLIMDFGYAEELKSAQLAAVIVFIGSINLAVFSGIWVWYL